MPITQIDPYYRVGTATFAASTAVVGQGTQWLSNVEPGDQIFNRLGQMAVVASVNSDVSITLNRAFAGTVQTAQVYEVYRISDTVRMENFFQRMINLLTGGNVTSFGNLDGTGGGKVPVFTGAGALNNLTFAELLTAIGGAPASALATAALKAANLSDMANKRIALDNLQLKGANVASAAAIDLTAATGHYVDVTGTATTTSIVLAAGSWRLVRAAAAWKITTSANLILNNGTEATHTFAANDLILFVSDGTIVRGVILPIDGRPTMQLAAARMLGSVAAGGVQDLTQAQVRSFLGMSTFLSSLLASADGAAMWSAMGGTAGGAGSSRWIKLPNGLIVQFGSVSTNSSGVAGVVFPIAFTAAPLYADANPTKGGEPTTSIISAWPSDIISTGFNINGRWAVAAGGAINIGAGSYVMNWHAMGY